MNSKVDTLTYQYLVEPCRNFNVLKKTTILDPKDQREKLVFSNFAAGSLGNLIIVDVETGEGESIPLPGDNGAWALLNWKNEKLFVGTCAQYGYFHSLDLKSRTWSEPLRDGKETYFWNFTLGSDGMVYGGTYPGCVLLRYDPERHVLENLGRASKNPKNLYSRTVYGDIPGYIIVSGGFEEPFLSAWDMKKQEFNEFGVPGKTGDIVEINEKYIGVKMGTGDYAFYDSSTFELVDQPVLPKGWTAPKIKSEVPLKDGRIAGSKGQNYYLLDQAEDKPNYKRIPTEAPATRIHTLTADANGKVWGCSEFGQTIFCYDPQDGSYWNSSDVCNRGGEVYGMQFVGERLFMSSYVGGDHIVYDPTKPWDQLNNINPKTLESVEPALIRPEGRSVLGPDGNVWTGWGAKYGTYGGGLSRIDTKTLQVDSWYDPIPERAIAGLTADDQYLYFTTHGGGSGLAAREIECHFAVFSTEGEVVYTKEFDKKFKLGAVLAVGGKVLARTGNQIRIFDPFIMAFVKIIELGEACNWMVANGDGAATLFGTEHMYELDVQTGQVEQVMALPGRVTTATRTPNGDLYFAKGTELYKVIG